MLLQTNKDESDKQCFYQLCYKIDYYQNFYCTIKQEFSCVSWRYTKNIIAALQPAANKQFLAQNVTLHQLRQNVCKQVKDTVSTNILNWTAVQYQKVCVKCKHVLESAGYFNLQKEELNKLLTRKDLDKILVHNVIRQQKLYFEDINKEICTIVLY